MENNNYASFNNTAMKTIKQLCKLCDFCNIFEINNIINITFHFMSV